MDKNLPNDPLEEFFRKSLEDENQLPADDGWDLPSDAVWDRVEERIEPTAVIRPINYWKWTAIAASVIILLFAGNWFFQKEKIQNLNAEIEIQKQEIENVKELVQSLQTEKEKVEERFAEEKNHQNPNHQSTDNTDLVVENEATKTQANPQDSPESASFSGDGQDGIGGRNNDGSPTIPSISNEILENQISNTPIFENKNKTVENTTEPNFPIKKSQNIVGEKKEEALANQELLPIGKLPQQFLEIEETEEERKINLTPEEMYPSVVVATRKKLRPYIGVFGSKNYGTRRITGLTTNALDDRRRTLRESRDEEYWTTGGGIKAGVQLNNNWSIESGVYYSKTQMDVKNRFTRKFTQQGEMQVGSEFENDYALLIITPFGDADSDITISRNVPIAENTPFLVTTKSRVNVSFLGIPLMAKYMMGRGKFRVGLKGGVMSNFVLNSDFQIREINIQSPLLTHRRNVVRDKKEIKNIKSATFDFVGGLEIEAKVGKNTFLALEPSFSRSLTPIFEKQKVKTHPAMASMKVGMNYYF